MVEPHSNFPDSRAQAPPTVTCWCLLRTETLQNRCSLGSPGELLKLRCPLLTPISMQPSRVFWGCIGGSNGQQHLRTKYRRFYSLPHSLPTGTAAGEMLSLSWTGLAHIPSWASCILWLQDTKGSQLQGSPEEAAHLLLPNPASFPSPQVLTLRDSLRMSCSWISKAASWVNPTCVMYYMELPLRE